jgi:hypothetical protein
MCLLLFIVIDYVIVYEVIVGGTSIWCFERPVHVIEASECVQAGVSFDLDGDFY